VQLAAHAVYIVCKGSLKKQNRLVFYHAVFCWIDWLSGCLFVNGCLQGNAVAMRKRVGSLKTEFCEVKMALAVLRFMFLMDWALRLIAARATYFLCFAKV